MSGGDLRKRVLTAAKDYTRSDRVERGKSGARGGGELLGLVNGPELGEEGREGECLGWGGGLGGCLFDLRESTKTKAAPPEAECFQDLTSRMFSQAQIRGSDPLLLTFTCWAGETQSSVRARRLPLTLRLPDSARLSTDRLKRLRHTGAKVSM